MSVTSPVARYLLPAARSPVVAYAHRICARFKERRVNQTPPSQPAHPADVPEPAAPDTSRAVPSDEHADGQPSANDESRDREMPAPHREPAEEPARAATLEDEYAREEKKAADVAPPPAPRPPVTPPPLPTFGGPQQPPRFAAPPLRPPGPSAQPSPQPPAEQPPYPPRAPAPPAPPGGMAEPPRPYEGGRYVPPPPIPPTGPTVPGRDWAPANTTIAPQPQPAPQAVAPRGNPLTTALLGIIAVLLLALAVFQGINTFHPKAVPPTGVQQVQVQKQQLKPDTANEIKDTIDKAQAALNQFNQQAQQAYSSATNDQQRAAVLLQLSLFLQQIIAQQNNDLLLIYQDLNT
jgi:hypothetical protein